MDQHTFLRHFVETEIARFYTSGSGILRTCFEMAIGFCMVVGNCFGQPLTQNTRLNSDWVAFQLVHETESHDLAYEHHSDACDLIQAIIIHGLGYVNHPILIETTIPRGYRRYTKTSTALGFDQTVL
jgi:hypothetical protein